MDGIIFISSKFVEGKPCEFDGIELDYGKTAFSSIGHFLDARSNSDIWAEYAVIDEKTVSFRKQICKPSIQQKFTAFTAILLMRIPIGKKVPRIISLAILLPKIL